MDDPEQHEGGRRPSGHGPFIDVPVDDDDANCQSFAPGNRQSTVGSANRASQVVGSRKSLAANSNRNSTIGGNRRSQYDDNRVSMFSFSAPPNRTSAYSAVAAPSSNRNSRAFVDPRANLGPLKVGDGGTAPRAPGDVLPGETPAVSSMKQYNTLGVNQSSIGGGAGGNSGSGRTSRRAASPANSHTNSTKGGQSRSDAAGATPSPRQARRARVNTNTSNRSSVVSDATPSAAAFQSAAMDRKPSWDSQVGQNLRTQQQGRRPSADGSTGAGASGWGSDDDK